jgi:hypothetical protein
MVLSGWTGLPDFSWCKIPKREKYSKTLKIYQITTKYTKWPYSILNDSKIDQMAKNIPTSSFERPNKIYPNWDIWFKNMCAIWQPCGRARTIDGDQISKSFASPSLPMTT